MKIKILTIILLMLAFALHKAHAGGMKKLLLVDNFYGGRDNLTTVSL